MAKVSERTDLYESVTDKICAALEAGTIPWRRPWRDLGGAGFSAQPRNRVSNKPYRGINVFLLDMVALANNYSTNEWVTFKQAQSLKGSVKKGAKGTQIIFWKFLKKEEDGKEVTVPLLRYYYVFNLDQCEGISPRERTVETLPEPSEPTEEGTAAETLLKAYFDRAGVTFCEGHGNKACYVPSLDSIHMPDRRTFGPQDGFWATLSHEAGHSTGHEKRLNRDITGWSRDSYGKEELVAEMTAAFFCRLTGLNQDLEDNSAAYVGSWLKTLRVPGNKRLVVTAAGQAQRAFEYIVGTVEESEEEEA